MTELPVVTDCTNCGKCCETQGSPPFIYLHPSLYIGNVPADWGVGAAETERWTSVPAEALALLQDYHAEGKFDRYDHGLPCLWYDEVTKKCKYHAWRPDVCRDFEVGGIDCLNYRGELPKGYKDE